MEGWVASEIVEVWGLGEVMASTCPECVRRQPRTLTHRLPSPAARIHTPARPRPMPLLHGVRVGAVCALAHLPRDRDEAGEEREACGALSRDEREARGIGGELVEGEEGGDKGRET